jgi:small subunit ribosomal protein S5
LKYKASQLLLKPAPPGTGLKVGGVVRVILDIAGVNNASGKIMGTRNQITNAYALMEAIKKMKPRIGPESKKLGEVPPAEVAVPEVKEESKEAVKKEAPVKTEKKEVLKAETKPAKVKETTEKKVVTKVAKKAPKKKS